METCKVECSLELDGIDHKGMEHALVVSEGPHIAFHGVSEEILTSVDAVFVEILTSTVRVSEEIWSDLVSDVAEESEIFVVAVSVESEISAAFEEIDHAFIEEKESLACAEEIASSALARQTLVHKIVWKAS